MKTIEDIKQAYKPKQGFALYLFKSTQTGRFVALIQRKDIVSYKKSEWCDSAIGNISTEDINKLLKFIEPYVEPVTES